MTNSRFYDIIKEEGVKMAKISVIVPVYNTKIEYLGECLDSIKNSSFQNLEVIVVDDGSEIDYKRLMKKYPTFHYFRTENKGTLQARLFGLSMSSGDYISFIDSDDKMTFDYLEAMFKCANDTNSDIVFNDWAFWTRRNIYMCGNDSTINSDFVFRDDILLRFFSYYGSGHAYYVLWNKLFKREVLLRAKEEIDKLDLGKMVFAEDMLISFFAFANAKSIANVHSGCYFYRIHNNQQIYVDEKSKFLNQVHSMAKVFDIMEQYLKESGNYENLCDFLFKWRQLMASNNYITAKHSKYDNVKDVILNAYKIDKFTTRTNNTYMNHILLPNNITEIEEKLKQIFFSNHHLKIYAKRGSYSYKRLMVFKELFLKSFEVTKSKNNEDVVMPKDKISLKSRILHSDIVLKLGTRLFPKGSKIRKILKAKF